MGVQAIRFQGFVPAYYLTDDQRDYVVMSELGDKRGRVAIHEYVHVLIWSDLSTPECG
jgi:hypothetical protein